MNTPTLMKKVFTIGLSACALLALLSTTPASADSAQIPGSTGASAALSRNNLAVVPDDPEATYQGARIVHNVKVGGKAGMRVHAKFTVKYGEDVECQLIAYFYYDDAENTPLKASDPRYRTKSGNVSASANFTPGYDPAVYNDMQLFIPYDALNMESGEEHDLKFYLALYDKEGGRFFGKSGWYKFQLTMP